LGLRVSEGETASLLSEGKAVSLLSLPGCCPKEGFAKAGKKRHRVKEKICNALFRFLIKNSHFCNKVTSNNL
jgi:hypothetical protein